MVKNEQFVQDVKEASLKRVGGVKAKVDARAMIVGALAGQLKGPSILDNGNRFINRVIRAYFLDI